MATALPIVPLPQIDVDLTTPRRTPSQQRSRERVERILTVAAGLIGEHGSDALRMSDVAAAAGISIGSLYQYFPDKGAVVRSLAERFNAFGQSCVARDLEGVTDLDGLCAAIERSVDGYYGMFVDLPAMREIWSGTQADKALQAIDVADTRAHAALLASVVRRIAPDGDPAHLDTVTVVLMQTLAANVRLAITVGDPEGPSIISATKRLLTRGIRAELFAETGRERGGG